MDTICSAGALYLCLIGNLFDDQIAVQQIDTYQNAFDFYERSKELLEQEHDIVLYAVLGIKDKVEKIADIIQVQIKGNFERILRGEYIEITGDDCFDQTGAAFDRLVQESIFAENIVKFPRKYVSDNDEWEMCCFWAGKNEKDETYLLINDVIETWCSYEQPAIYGKQIMTRSFQLADMSGRKIIGVYPDRNTFEWIAVLEGGMKLSLNSAVPYMRERIDVRDIGQFWIGDIDSIVNNPIYSHGKYFYPLEIYQDWHKVFLYAAALRKGQWDTGELRKAYERFLAFLEENICDVEAVESTCVDKNTYYEALAVTVTEMQKYLEGEDLPVISRDLWRLLNSRYVYLPYICKKMKISMREENMTKGEAGFDRQELAHKIRDAETQGAYQKGLKWEEAVEYFLEQIDGLRISGRRVRTIAQEIDLSVVNISYDQKLWEMGAYILVECKNWKAKVGIEVIRGLSHISELKGNKTTFLFTVNGISQNAQDEIERLVVNGKYILHITKKELQDIKSRKECYELLVRKWDELRDRAEEELFS